MPQTLKARLTATSIGGVAIASVLFGVVGYAVGSHASLFGNSENRIALVISIGLGFFAVIAAIVMSVHNLLKPLTGLARASREVVRGRHPSEAFADDELTGELGNVATDIRQLSLRLREIDASDRRFLMSISHELRTPLTAITGHAQLLEDGVVDDREAAIKSLQVIQHEAERLERLVEDIVDLARLRSNRFTTVSETVWLDELGEHLLQIFSDAELSSDHTVKGTFDHVQFHSDGQRILQIIRNLVNNGLRYAQTGVTVTGERVQKHIRIAVVNDGPEISATEAEQIFEPFVGTKREGGLGLGLAIGRELAWALGGNLACVPHHGGAEFELTLPLETPDLGR